MVSRVWKICQRRLYSWLSSKCGLPLCILGILLVITSAFQFGEVLLEWSKERYAAQFSIYSNNIAGKSYEHQLCFPLPIDLVYTWVNGSDPILLEQIKELKRNLVRKATPFGISSNFTSNNASNSASISSCPFTNCIPWRTLVIDAANLSQPLSIDNIGRVFPVLQKGVVMCSFFNGTKTHTSIYTVRMATEDQVTSILKTGLLDSHGYSVSVRRGFITSDQELVGAIMMERFHIAISDGICPLNSSKLFRKWMGTHFGRAVAEAEVKMNRTAVVGLKSKEVSGLSNNTHLFFGETVSFHQAYLIWMPFHFQDSEDAELQRPDIISSSRFQDNEELRYSLRSVERFAPWIRHVFIVTNGQIPAWLDMDNTRVTVVTHEEIFQNLSHLPTYSSPAIESHLHHIPGLADHFIYLNDDVMFGDYIWPEDFYTHQKGQKVYLSWPVPHCAEGCPPSWIRDRYCDANCNNSACDWDGGDCSNGTHRGPQGIHHGAYSLTTGSQDYCSPGCLNSWLGDRYCDSACRVPDCGFDAGDCGTDKWEKLLGYRLGPLGGNFTAPLATTALYFNLSDIFTNGSITEATFSPCYLIRTVIVAKKYQVLAITFSRNASQTTANFTIVGTSHGNHVSVNLTLTGDTVTKNKSGSDNEHRSLDIAGSNDTTSREFLEAIVAGKAPSSINYWIPERTHHTPSLPVPPALITNYIVPNFSLLPANLFTTLQALEKVWKDGELTQRGYLRERSTLLQHHLHLVTPNGTLRFGYPSDHAQRVQGMPLTQQKGDDGGGAGGGMPMQAGGDLPAGKDRRHMELNKVEDSLGGFPRKLLEFSKESPLLEWLGPSRRLPWEKLHLFPDTPTVKSAEEEEPYVLKHYSTRKLMEVPDTFADSLRYVNRLYTKVYGHSSRKVPSHMPHFIQRKIMASLQGKFPEEFAITSSHKLRMADDMQFAFSYFYFVMSEKKEIDMTETFAEFDADHSGILSVREMRTLLAKITKLPITHDNVRMFENLLISCNEVYNGTRPQVTPEEYETHYDLKLPLVTLDFMMACTELVKKLNASKETIHKYKFEETAEDLIIFKMISENSSEVIMMLDEIRKQQKKFICLNDNINHAKEGAELAKLVLVDFYESLFPIPSQFELPMVYRNRFLHLHELNEWLRFKKLTNVLVCVCMFSLLATCFCFLFYNKVVRWKRRLTRPLNHLFSSARSRALI